jgi:hypothetical protein
MRPCPYLRDKLAAGIVDEQQPHEILQVLMHLAGVHGAAREVGVVRVLARFPVPDQFEESLPVAVRVDHHADVAVAGLVRVPLGGKQARIARVAGGWVEGLASGVIGHDGLHHGLEHRHIDPLPLARPRSMDDGPEDCRDCMDRHVAVDGSHRRVARHAIAVQFADEAGDAGYSLDEVVKGRAACVRPVLPEPEGADVDQARVADLQIFVCNPERLRGLRPHVVEQNVRTIEQFQQRILSGRMLQIEDDASLVSVRVEVHRPHPGVVHRPYLSDAVSVHRLHLDHVGAHVAQNPSGKWRHDDSGNFHDLDAFQRPHLDSFRLRHGRTAPASRPLSASAKSRAFVFPGTRLRPLAALQT